MTKPEILSTIVEGGLAETKKGALELVEKVSALVDLFEEKLEVGDKAKFGRLVLEAVHKDARVARNPKTNESILIPQQKKIKFKASEVMYNENKNDTVA